MNGSVAISVQCCLCFLLCFGFSNAGKVKDVIAVEVTNYSGTTITSVIPNQIQRTTFKTLDLVIDNLPSLTGPFLCAFTVLDKTLVTNASITGNGVNCPTPRADSLPSIPQGQHHFDAKLSVRMTTGPAFASTNFTFFDCSTFSSCTQCVSSSFPCDWCVDGNRCTHDVSENCKNDILITGVSRASPSYRSGPAFCPTISSTVGHSPEILVASGTNKAIKVKAHIIGQFIIQTRFLCQFIIEGRVTSVNAQLLGDTIYCDPVKFSYTSLASNITATFDIIWGGSKPLDNPDNIHIVIYRCRDMADNCGTCLALAEKYDCGWCQNSDRCDLKDQCERDSMVWLNRKQTCPNPKVVSKVKVQEYTYNCFECLGVKDPNYGWCSVEKKCSLRSDCQDAARDPLKWISYESGRCTTITSVIPNQVQRTTVKTLDLVIDNLPSLTGPFLCAFTALDKTLVTNASITGNGVNCPTLRTDSLPSIPQGQHHFDAKLSVRMTTGPAFASTNFTFFDCSTFNSCTQCVSSSFPCDWCVDGNRCTHDVRENCRNDILVTGVSRAGPSYRTGPAFCPAISLTVGHSPKILVASGTKKAIKVKAHIIGQFIIQTRFVCQFNIEGRVTSVNGQLLADTIYCDPMKFSYTSLAPNITATFDILWGGSKPLDNPDNIHIVIYRCRDMADNCGSCLALAEKYDCGWCQSSKRCEVKDQCERDSMVWLNHSQTCPNPDSTK